MRLPAPTRSSCPGGIGSGSPARPTALIVEPTRPVEPTRALDIDVIRYETPRVASTSVVTCRDVDRAARAPEDLTAWSQLHHAQVGTQAGMQVAAIAVSVGLIGIATACGPGAPAAPTTAAAGNSAALANTPVVAAGGTPLTTFVTPVPPTAAPAPAGATPATRAGGTLHLALPNEPDAPDPAKTIQLFADSINTHIYERLVYIGQDRQPHPWLADFDRILDPANASPAKAQMGTLESVEVVDPQTVRFNFSEAYAPIFTNISLGYGGIVSPTAVQKYGDAFGHNPVGSGPFRFKSWDAGQKLTLERSPDYQNVRDDEQNKGAPYVDALEWRFIPEAATRLAALQSGELDVSDVDFQQAPTVQSNSNLQLMVWQDALEGAVPRAAWRTRPGRRGRASVVPRAAPPPTVPRPRPPRGRCAARPAPGAPQSGPAAARRSGT
jgi:hypothetical protein